MHMILCNLSEKKDRKQNKMLSEECGFIGAFLSPFSHKSALKNKKGEKRKKKNVSVFIL